MEESATTLRQPVDEHSTKTESGTHDELQHGVTGPPADEAQPIHGHQHSSSPTNHPASSPSIAGSTVVVYPREADTATQPHEPLLTATGATVENSHEAASSDGIQVDTSSGGPSPTPPPTEIGDPSVSQAKTTSTSTAIASSPTTQPHTERYIPSYEQWRKQILEKNKPANANERKLRKRKPYQDNAVDVAIGSEDELGFVFQNMDGVSGSSKSGDNRFEHLADQLGNGPDLRRDDKDKQWIKSEYAKDPKDRFNHASGTCAASVVKASKDATSIMAILNEGKDNYMLNKCSSKDKFFVVELCEEILVDTFVFGNYEFFSSTFKDFVVSVNRYPPRDDGWSILGHFQARNTRDAQVFKPTVPQLATYIRFDLLSHYGNEYYCPITLLRVYGATALEQLKQEEEEEKRQAEEEKRQAELEKARQAAAAADDDPDDIEDTEVVEPTEPTVPEPVIQHSPTHIGNNDMATSDHQTIGQPETIQDEGKSVPTITYPDTVSSSEIILDHTALPSQSKESDHETHIDDIPLVHGHPDSESTSLEEPTSTEEPTHKDDPTVSHVVPPDTTLRSFEETTSTFSSYPSVDVLLPAPSTSPASMEDDNDWNNPDLEMITFSPKARPTRPHVGPKPSSGGLGTSVSGTPSSAEAPPHPSPSPQHSSQESVYKNIVNRLKILELNSTLSYQYLEEQSNIYNDVLESSEQRINQLVTHLNEAIRRLETLGRKYDQLAYSYRAHVEIDGEKHRQDFINLSSQVHLLGSQVMFQRQLFVVGAITLFSIIAFIAITRSNTMHYAIQQSPLGAKLRAISGHRNEARSNDISSSVRIGSIEGLSQFDQNSLMLHHSNEERDDSLDQGAKMSRPISPITPLAHDPNHTTQSRILDNHERSLMDSAFPDAGVSRQNDSTIQTILSGNDNLPISHPETTSAILHHHHPSEAFKTKLMTSLHDQFLASRTPYPTPKSGFGGPGRLIVQPHHNQPPQPILYSHDFGPSSPVFQGPSSVHDEAQLSDADVAYMSRDMGVGRKGASSPGSVPSSPATRKPFFDFYNHIHHPTRARRLSNLRNDSTASLTAQQEPDSPNALHPSPMIRVDTDRLETSVHDTNQTYQEDMMPDNGELATKSMLKAPAIRTRKECEDEDVGFVSDSVLDSASEGMTSSRDVLPPTGVIGDWDKHHGPGEVVPGNENDETDDHINQHPAETKTFESSKTKGDSSTNDVAPERPPLSRDGSSKSRKSSSHSILRSQEFTASNHTKNHSASAALGLGVGVGLGIGSDNEPSVQDMVPRLEPSALSHPEMISRDEIEANNDGVQVDDTIETPPPGQGVSERRKKKKHSQSEDRLRRRMSYGRQESADSLNMEDRGQDGDDEGSPQVSRRAGY